MCSNVGLCTICVSLSFNVHNFAVTQHNRLHVPIAPIRRYMLAPKGAEWVAFSLKFSLEVDTVDVRFERESATDAARGIFVKRVMLMRDR